jgi:hypothetical protein
MHIWMSNSRTSLAYERVFFAIVCNNLIHRRGARRVAKRFQSLATLSALPWLDQPRFLDPARLIFEIHEAWDELWTLRAQELVVAPATEDAARPFTRSPREADCASGEEVFGRYLAAPLHKLAAFAASSGPDACVRAATHRELIVGPQRLQGWRIIQGGRSHACRTLASAVEVERDRQHSPPGP